MTSHEREREIFKSRGHYLNVNHFWVYTIIYESVRDAKLEKSISYWSEIIVSLMNFSLQNEVLRLSTD